MFLFCSMKENEDSPRRDSGSKSIGSPRYIKELKDEVCSLQLHCMLILMTIAGFQYVISWEMKGMN